MRWPEGFRCLKRGTDRVSSFTSSDAKRERTNRKGPAVEVARSGGVSSRAIKLRAAVSSALPLHDICRHTFAALHLVQGYRPDGESQ
jgi:hypothetical protein